jgi:CubicO group peptidase (beta-lactamase class C family)
VRLPEGIDGTCDARFAAIPEILAEQLASGAHHGVAVAVRHRGEPVVDVWGGRRRALDGGGEQPWTEDTMVLSFSTTKGPASTALHMVMERAGVDYDAPVASIWPEFGKSGKDGVTIRHVLCHEAGVPQIRGEIADVSEMADWDAMVAMMERLAPLWPPGTENGYHAINFGWMVGELVRRIDGRDLTTFIAEELAGPLGLDGFHVGTPPSEHGRVARVFHPQGTSGGDLYELIPRDHLLWRALAPDGDFDAYVNSAAGLSSCAPAFNGVFTARSLATFYAALERGGALGRVRLLSPDTLASAVVVQNERPDLVLFVPIRWRLGFMGGGHELSPGGPNREAFGHAGLGGSVAFADPKAEVAVAVVLDRLEWNFLGGDRILRVVHAAVHAAEANP